MFRVKKNRDIIINYDSICKFILLTFICCLYALYEKRLVIEIIYITVFGLYFITRRCKLSILSLWSFIFISICFLFSLQSVNLYSSLKMIRKLIELSIICTLLIGYIDSKKKLLFIYKCFIYAGFAMILRLLISFPISEWGAERLGDDILNANQIGMYIAISAICSMQLYKIRNQRRYLIYIVIFFIVCSLSGSRKAFLMFFAGVSLVNYINTKKIHKRVISIILIAFALYIGYKIVMSVPELYNILGIRIERLFDTIQGTGVQDRSAKVRFEMISVGRNLFENKWMIGYGISTYKFISGYGMYSHNNYIELLVGVGLLGTIVYYSIYLYTIIKLIRRREYCYTNAFLVIILLLLFMEYGLVSYYGEVYQILIALAIAAIRISDMESISINKVGGEKLDNVK